MNAMQTVIWTICFVLLSLGIASGGEEPNHNGSGVIPDFTRLADFYNQMGEKYGELKKITEDTLGNKTTAETFSAQMSQWKREYDAKGYQAPCPNNDWRTYYTELSPVHYDMCFAWAELGAIHTSLLMADPEAVTHHESEFKRLSLAISKILQHSELTESKDDFFALK